jgi:hypothetical protein
VAEAFLLTRDPFADWEFSIAKLAIEFIDGMEKRSVELKAGDGMELLPPLSAERRCATPCALKTPREGSLYELTRGPTQKNLGKKRLERLNTNWNKKWVIVFSFNPALLVAAKRPFS